MRVRILPLQPIFVMFKVFWQHQFQGQDVKVGNRLYNAANKEEEWRCKQIWENGAIEAVELRYKVTANGLELGTFNRGEFMDRFNDILGPFAELEDIGSIRVAGDHTMNYSVDQIELEK